MQIFDNGKIYNFMGARKFAFFISASLMLLSLILFLFKGFNYGIDFSGGTLVQIKYNSKAPLSEIRKALDKSIIKNANVTEFGSDEEVIIRYSSTNEALGSNPGEVIAKLLANTGKFEVRRVDMVGPKVGSDLKKNGILAVIISFILILIYIAIRFEWRFALACIFAEIHDLLITIGAIIIFKVEFNLDILAAILTILGYSLNDTIIVFDRIREGIKEAKSNNLLTIINESVSKTLSRTILTSLTTLISVVILYIYGGDMIHGFSLVMIVGVIAGTLSSVYISAQTLIWLKFDVKSYKKVLINKEKLKIEKEKIRAMYEKGVV